MLEGALAELQERVARYSEELSGGTLTLVLKPTQASKSKTKAVFERIEKSVLVRLSDGQLVSRTLRQLSGGERRRVGLALALAYAEFASERSGVFCNLMVLDEVLQVREEREVGKRERGG